MLCPLSWSVASFQKGCIEMNRNIDTLIKLLRNARKNNCSITVITSIPLWDKSGNVVGVVKCRPHGRIVYHKTKNHKGEGDYEFIPIHKS